MKDVDILIVGGSAAGITAAVTAKKYYPDKKISMVKNVVNVPIPCGIPYIFGTIGDASKNTLPTDKMMEANSIETIQDGFVNQF